MAEETRVPESKELIDKSNPNNHAGIEKREASEKADALLKLINEYRMYAHRFESLPTRDVLEFLSRFQKELFKRYEEDLVNWERDRLREEYFLQVGKKPFLWWSTEEIKEKLEEYRNGLDTKNTEYGLNYKKSQWKKQMK